MTKSIFATLLCGSAATALAYGAARADTPAQPGATSNTLSAVVVTARRQAENIQNVPNTVSAISGDTIRKLAITRFEDLSTTTAGLQLFRGDNGTFYTMAVRGLYWDVNTGAVSTVGLYLNDAPLETPGLAFLSLFDIGDIEVLKGPQGTTRGVSAPSGAIAITTRKPNMSEYGANANFTGSNLAAENFTGAVNIPLINDVLAVRIAGQFDRYRGSGVTSLHDSQTPHTTTWAGRFSLRFRPNDRWETNFTYQHVLQRILSYPDAFGPGPGAFSIGNTFFPATVNPPLMPQQRKSVSDIIGNARVWDDTYILESDYRVFNDYHLQFIGSLENQFSHACDTGTTGASSDQANFVPGADQCEIVIIPVAQRQAEVRFTREPSTQHWFDPTVGYYYNANTVTGFVDFPYVGLPGLLGNSPTPNPAAFNPLYEIPLHVPIHQPAMENSIYGNVLFHFFDGKVELNTGFRHVWTNTHFVNESDLGSGHLNTGAIPGGPFPCPMGDTAGPGPNDCTLPPIGKFVTRTHFSQQLTLYNISLSWHLTPDFMFYGTTGTAFRPGVAQAGITNPNICSDPNTSFLCGAPPETSTSYEGGFKSTWFDHRVRLDFAYFHQSFQNFIFSGTQQPYNNGQGGFTTTGFTSSLPATVDGIDLDAAFQITPDWNLQGSFSYAKSTFTGGVIPCSIPDGHGGFIFNTDGLVSLCPVKGQPAAPLPQWTMNLSSEYHHPFSDTTEGFVRGLLNVYGHNWNAHGGEVPAYTLLNIYAGVRSRDGAWELSFFAKNIGNTFRLLDSTPNTLPPWNPITTFEAQVPHFAASSGYFEGYRMTPLREFGINLRYAWGAR